MLKRTGVLFAIIAIGPVSITAAGILDHGVYQAYDLMEGKIK